MQVENTYMYSLKFYINSIEWVRFDTDNTGWGSAWWEYTLNPWRERNRKFVLALFAATGLTLTSWNLQTATILSAAKSFFLDFQHIISRSIFKAVVQSTETIHFVSRVIYTSIFFKIILIGFF